MQSEFSLDTSMQLNLKHGKKTLAYQIIYRAMKKIQQKTETNPLFILRQAIRGVTLDIVVKARRVGGSTHQVPIEIVSTQGKALVICHPPTCG